MHATHHARNKVKNLKCFLYFFTRIILLIEEEGNKHRLKMNTIVDVLSECTPIPKDVCLGVGLFLCACTHDGNDRVVEYCSGCAETRMYTDYVDEFRAAGIDCDHCFYGTHDYCYSNLVYDQTYNRCCNTRKTIKQYISGTVICGKCVCFWADVDIKMALEGKLRTQDGSFVCIQR